MKLTFNFQVDKRSKIGKIIMRARCRGQYIMQYTIYSRKEIVASVLHNGKSIYDEALSYNLDDSFESIDTAATDVLLNWISSQPDLIANYLQYIVPFLTDLEKKVPYIGNQPPKQNIYVDDTVRPVQIIYIGKYVPVYDVGDNIYADKTRYVIHSAKDLFSSNGKPTARICLVTKGRSS